MANPTTPSPGEGYTWVDGSFYGGEGGYQLPGQWVQTGAAPAATPATNTVGGPNAAINANWRPPQPIQNQLAELYANPVSGYSPNANYGAGFGRFQFSASAPVPKTAPLGWGRYPGVDGAPPSAPWLTGQTMPPPRWGNTNLPPVIATPPPNVVGNTPGGTTPPPVQPPGGTTPPPYNWNNGFPSPSERVTGGTTASQATGMNGYGRVPLASGGVLRTRSPTAVPQQYANYYIPPNYVGRQLPVGAFTSLFPNSQGTDWSMVKPANWGPNWRPTKLGG
jgi:hypothetical protein